MADSYRLIVRRGPQPNQTYDLTKDVISLGRDITNDIVINDPEVSRHHLRLTRGADGFNIEDLGSTNGTFINGQRLSGVRSLRRGDMIGLGETVTLGYEIVREMGEQGGAAQSPAGPTMQYAPPEQSFQQPAPQQPPQETPPPQQPQQDPYSGYAPQQQPLPPQQDPYYGQGQQQPGYDYAQQPVPDYGYGQGAPGYDYDPYAMREEQPRSTLSWIAIGCAILSVFCCCGSIVGLVVIDALELWYDLPIVRDLAPLFESIANALGLI